MSFLKRLFANVEDVISDRGHAVVSSLTFDLLTNAVMSLLDIKHGMNTLH